MLNRKNRIIAGLTAALGAAAIGSGAAAANAAPMEPPPPPPAPTVVDTPEPGDGPDVAGALDTDNIQEGDQNGPEVPDTPAPAAPPGH
jgi:hypothetical protein